MGGAVYVGREGGVGGINAGRKLGGQAACCVRRPAPSGGGYLKGKVCFYPNAGGCKTQKEKVAEESPTTCTSFASLEGLDVFGEPRGCLPPVASLRYPIPPAPFTGGHTHCTCGYHDQRWLVVHKRGIHRFLCVSWVSISMEAPRGRGCSC